jgi:hypothetical protein
VVISFPQSLQRMVVGKVPPNYLPTATHKAVGFEQEVERHSRQDATQITKVLVAIFPELLLQPTPSTSEMLLITRGLIIHNRRLWREWLRAAIS